MSLADDIDVYDGLPPDAWEKDRARAKLERIAAAKITIRNILSDLVDDLDPSPARAHFDLNEGAALSRMHETWLVNRSYKILVEGLDDVLDAAALAHANETLGEEQ